MPRAAGGSRDQDRFLVSAAPRGPRTQRCLHTPPAATVARRPPKWASPLRHGRVPLPPFHPIGRLPEPMGGSGGRHFGPKFTSGGALGAAMSVGGHDGPESRLRPRESVGVLALAEFPRTGRHPHLQASAWGSRGPPVLRRALRAPWPPAGGSQDSMFGASFLFSGSPGLFVGSSSSRVRQKELGACCRLVVV